jgi:anti-sigma B factor antagonist
MQLLLARPQTSFHEAIVIQPTDSLTAATVVQFHSELNWAVGVDHRSNLLVDMQQVDQIDREGLMALVSALKLAQKFKKQIFLCSVSYSVRMILELTRLDSILEIIEMPTLPVNSFVVSDRFLGKEIADQLAV